MRRIGILGGSFDPVHYGHLLLAESCQEQCGLDEVWFVPAEMKDSFLAGWTHLQESSALAGNDAILMAPADMPHLSSPIINQLLDFHSQYPESILAPEYQGRRGHPVLFPATVAQAVSRLASDQGLNTLWGQFPHQSVAVDTDDSFGDFDTPQDWPAQQ